MTAAYWREWRDIDISLKKSELGVWGAEGEKSNQNLIFNILLKD